MLSYYRMVVVKNCSPLSISDPSTDTKLSCIPKHIIPKIAEALDINPKGSLKTVKKRIDDELKKSNCSGEWCYEFDMRIKEEYLQAEAEGLNGIDELVKRTIIEENRETEAMTDEEKVAARKRIETYLDSEIFEKAKQIAQYEYATGTTTEQMLEDLATGKFRIE